MNNCENCRFGIRPTNSKQMECRAHAPSPLVSNDPKPTAVWPWVAGTDWCGAWKMKKAS